MKTCKIADCNRNHHSSGYCNAHYWRAKNGGDMNAPIISRNPTGATLADKYWQRAVVKEEGCWDWSGATGPTGYAKVSHHRKPVGAHRVSWEIHNGPIPEGAVIDHLCHNRKCTNPSHLRVTTQHGNSLNLAGLSKANKSGHRNVYWRKDMGAWRVGVKHNFKTVDGGTYSNIEHAIEAAEKLRLELHGPMPVVPNGS